MIQRLRRTIYKRISGERFHDFNWEIDLDRRVSEHDFVVFDTEVSGEDFKRAKLLSIGAFKLKGLTLRMSEFLDLRINVQLEDYESIKVHGITPDQLRSGVHPKEAWSRFYAFARGSVLVGYFAEIDVYMLKRLVYEEFGAKFCPYFIDVVDFWDGTSIPTLEELVRRFGLPVSKTHDALEDAYMTALVFMKLLKKYENVKLSKMPIRTL